MKQARDFLQDFFSENPERTQAEFAKAAGMTGANLSDLLGGRVEISYRNLPRLLNGFESRSDKLEFLTAYLRDEVPADFEGDIVVAMKGGGRKGKAAAREEEFAAAWRALPGAGMQARILQLLRALRNDEALRDLFVRITDYMRR